LCLVSLGKIITNIRELDERAVHVEAEVLVKILTLSLQHVLRAVTEVDQLVDDPRGDQIKRRLASLERKSFRGKKSPYYQPRYTRIRIDLVLFDPDPVITKTKN
jgi:hypothetical protein